MMRVTAGVAVVFALVAVLLYAAYSTVASIGQHFREAYAVDWTSEFIIHHLRANDNRWPRNWDDLRDEYDTLKEPGHYSFTFEQLQQQVWVDWDTNARELVEAANENLPVEVVKLRSGSGAHFEGSGPNQRIMKYLRENLETTGKQLK